jgi:energy-coupling factor transport system permease protein
MLSGSLLFVTTTHPSKLLRALDAAQCPPALSFLLASPLLLIGEFTARATAISHAQQARGMRVDNPLSRLRAVTVLIVPLITLALADASERSQVLTARGFRALPRRTVLVAPADSILERRLRFLFLAATAALSGYALWR